MLPAALFSIPQITILNLSRNLANLHKSRIQPSSGKGKALPKQIANLEDSWQPPSMSYLAVVLNGNMLHKNYYTKVFDESPRICDENPRRELGGASPSCAAILDDRPVHQPSQSSRWKRDGLSTIEKCIEHLTNLKFHNFATATKRKTIMVRAETFGKPSGNSTPIVWYLCTLGPINALGWSLWIRPSGRVEAVFFTFVVLFCNSVLCHFSHESVLSYFSLMNAKSKLPTLNPSTWVKRTRN